MLLTTANGNDMEVTWMYNGSDMDVIPCHSLSQEENHYPNHHNGKGTFSFFIITTNAKHRLLILP